MIFYSDEEFGRDILYSDFLWPKGLGFAVGTAFSMPTDETLIISLERERAKGPAEMALIARLDALRPHIARSAYLSVRQQMVRAQDTAAVLSRIGLPAIVLTDEGKVLAVNDLVNDLKTHLVWRAGDRLALKDHDAERLFTQAIATIRVDAVATVRSFVLRGPNAAASAVAHVVPLRRSARDLFARCAAVLVLTPVAMQQAPSIELVQSLFDLTPAEARVARGIATGETVQEIAAGGGVSSDTVRTQLRFVFEKTGCRRQAEVVSLLGGLRSLA